MNKNYLLLGGAVLVISLVIYSLLSRDKLAYFEYNKVYNECKLKETLEKDLEKVVSVRKSELDSIQLELSLLSTKVEGGNATPEELNKFEDSKGRFLNLQQRYEEENMRLKDNYAGQIRKEINDKAKLFAEKNGYTVLFGAVGDGSIMYADKSLDVTEEFQEFMK